MKLSDFHPGDRVRVIAPDDPYRGWSGDVLAVTSRWVVVNLDGDKADFKPGELQITSTTARRTASLRRVTKRSKPKRKRARRRTARTRLRKRISRRRVMSLPKEERRYHVVAISEHGKKAGQKVYMTATPATHREATTILSKMTPYSWLRYQLEPAN